MKIRLYLLGLFGGMTGLSVFLVGVRYRRSMEHAQPLHNTVSVPGSTVLEQPHNLSVQLSDDVAGFAQKFLLAEFATLWQEIQSRVQIRERISILSVTIQGALLAFGLNPSSDKILYFRPTDALLLAALVAIPFEFMILRQFFRIALIKNYLMTDYEMYVRPYFKVGNDTMIPMGTLGWTSWRQGTTGTGITGKVDWVLSAIEANVSVGFGLVCYATYDFLTFGTHWSLWFHPDAWTHLLMMVTGSLLISLFLFVIIEWRAYSLHTTHEQPSS